MFWAKYRAWFLLIVYIVFFGHTALWHHFGWEEVGHLGFGCIFGTMRSGLVTAGTVFTLLIFLHALFLGGIFCGWMCHWGILQDLAAWMMRKLGIQPPMRQVNARYIPWFWFIILLGQVVLFWMYSGFPTSLSFDMDANPVWFMVPRSILMIVLTTIISGIALIFLFGERAFCRTICIFRIWFSWFERFAPHKIRQTKECSKCESECSTSCPMGLAVVEEVQTLGHIKNPECVKCYRCVGACPHAVLESSMKKNDFHKDGEAIVQKSSLSDSILYLQTALAVILVTFFGFKIGGNIALSLGFLIGVLLARMLGDKTLSWFEISVVAILGAAIYYRIDMNDATSTVKGLALLAGFLIIARLFPYHKGMDFLNEKAGNYKIPAVITLAFVAFAIFLGGREIHASMMVHKAKSAIARQDYDEYIAAMKSCADFVPNRAGAYFDLANAQLIIKDTDKAVENYKKSLSISFKREAAEVMLSKLVAANEPQAWQKLIDHLIKTYPEDYYFKLIKAKHLIATSQMTEAKSLIEEYISKQPKDPDGYLTLGNLLIAENDGSKALEQFEKAYELAPDQGAIGLAAYYRWNEEHLKAEEYFAQAIKHFPEDATIRVEQGVNFAMMNNLDAAIVSWKEALKINPDFGPAIANLERAQSQIQVKEGPRPGPFKRNLPPQTIGSH